MGCNDYNLHLDSSSGEQPTPEYNIYLDGVGVNGYNPTVDIVNSTSSSFQIQVNDINGTELTSPIPKLDYITNNYVSNTSLASTLADYSTTSEIASAYLKVDGSNANNPITINGMSIKKQYGNTYIDTTGSGFIRSASGIHISGSSIDLLSSGIGEIRLLNNYGIILNATENKNIFLQTSGTGKAYYNDIVDPTKEIATKGDIPTVGNGTITLTQGGVTKGTFTTNQSGNATIDLDSGAKNPLILNAYGEAGTGSIGIEAGATGADNEIWVGQNTGGGTLFRTLILLSDVADNITLTDNAFGTKKLSINTMTGADSVTGGAAGLVPAPAAGDQEKYLKGDGTWSTVTSGTTYTAGTGIDITNDVISVDNTVAMKTDIPSTNNFVTTNTAQTITANKVFDDSGILFYDEINDTNRNGITYNESIGIYVGDTGERLLLQGKDTHPYYNNNSLALSSEIPDVSNFVTTSDLSTTLASYVQSSSLATVATTGSYTDLLNKPTIPDTTNLVTLDTAQTITGSKTFSGSGSIELRKNLLLNNTGKISLVTNSSGIVFGANNLLSINSIAVRLGYTGKPIKINGQSTRPSYTDANNTTTDLALYSDIPTVPTNISSFTNDSGYITSSALSGYATQTWVGQQGYITGITSGDVTTALGYTPYNATNPDGFISGISSTDVINALGYTPYNSSNPNGYTSNVGTVTSVNNVQPDGNGNVTVTPTITVIDGGNA